MTPRMIAEKLKATYIEISPFIEKHTAIHCPNCQDVCCRDTSLQRCRHFGLCRCRVPIKNCFVDSFDTHTFSSSFPRFFLDLFIC